MEKFQELKKLEDMQREWNEQADKALEDRQEDFACYIRLKANNLQERIDDLKQDTIYYGD